MREKSRRRGIEANLFDNIVKHEKRPAMHEPVGASFDGVMRLATSASVPAAGSAARP